MGDTPGAAPVSDEAQSAWTRTTLARCRPASPPPAAGWTNRRAGGEGLALDVGDPPAVNAP